MSQQSYLIDTNILIGLEDYHKVDAAYARFLSLASSHKVDIFVHEAAKEDIACDRNASRREISLSKIRKYRVLRNTARPDRRRTRGRLWAVEKAQRCR